MCDVGGKGYESRNVTHLLGQLVTVTLGCSLEAAVVLVFGVDALAIVAVFQDGHERAVDGLALGHVTCQTGSFASNPKHPKRHKHSALTEKPSGCEVP